MWDQQSGVAGDDATSGLLKLAVSGDAPRGRVVIAGELDMLTAPRLGQLLATLFHAGYRELDVDASGVNFFAAAGLDVFLDASSRYQEAGGCLRLVALSPLVRRLLTMFGPDGDRYLVSPGDEVRLARRAARAAPPTSPG